MWPMSVGKTCAITWMEQYAGQYHPGNITYSFDIAWINTYFSTDPFGYHLYTINKEKNANQTKVPSL